MCPAIRTKSSPLTQLLLQLPLSRTPNLTRTIASAGATPARRARIPKPLTTAERPLAYLPVRPIAPRSRSRPGNNSRRANLSTSAAAMSEMPATSGHGAACCNVPPVVAKGYEGKGSYEELGGLKTYVTGPADATKAILLVYDIFGFFPQTIQGADILSSLGKEKYRVLIPDWFEGSPADISWYPPTDADKKQKLGAFFKKNPPPKVAGQVPDYVKAVSEKYPGIKTWAIMGFCWGGKVISLVTSSQDNPFAAAAECHPAMVDPADAKHIKVPLCMLASKDEDAGDVKKFADNLAVEKHVEIFGDQIHGWMAARADLEDARVEAEYRRGYETVLKFFGKVL